MFGLEVLDIVIGLMFVYLLLSLLATALNEYVAAVLNLRGKELAKGLGRLLDDIDDEDALEKAWDGLGSKVTTKAGSLTEQFYNHRLIRPFATRQGWMTRFWRETRGHTGTPRLPSYIPARTFALALLDVLGVDEKDASLDRFIPEIPAAPSVADAEQALKDAETAAQVNPADQAAAKRVIQARKDLDHAKLAQPVKDAEAALTTATQAQPADAKAMSAARAKLTQAKFALALVFAKEALATTQARHDAAPAQSKDQTAKEVAAARQALAKVEIGQVLAILKQESPIELTEHLGLLSGLPQADKLASALQVQVAGLVAGAQTQLQNLHDGVEVWFNNSMDRVSGAYKRTAQGWLFVLGLLIALCMNADTIDMWSRLESDDQLRAAMVRRAEAAVTAVDRTVVDSLRNPTPDTAAATAAGPDTAASNTTAGTTVTPPPAADSQTVALVSAPVDTTAGDTVTQSAPNPTPAATIPPQGGTNTQQGGTNTQPGGTSTQQGQTNPPRDSTNPKADSAAAAVKAARAHYLASRARLDSMELKLGWTRDNLRRIGLYNPTVARRDSVKVVKRDSIKRTGARIGRQRQLDSITKVLGAGGTPDDSAQWTKLTKQVARDTARMSWARRSQWWYGFMPAAPFTHTGPFFTKLLGLLLTAIAISLGAPFWFDMLNKVISIRSAGRAPDERPKSPEAGPKRAAERAPR